MEINADRVTSQNKKRRRIILLQFSDKSMDLQNVKANYKFGTLISGITGSSVCDLEWP